MDEIFTPVTPGENILVHANIKIEYMDEIFTPGENLGRFLAAGSHP